MSVLNGQMERLADAMEYDISSGNWDSGTLMACATVQIKRLKEINERLSNQNFDLRTEKTKLKERLYTIRLHLLRKGLSDIVDEIDKHEENQNGMD